MQKTMHKLVVVPLAWLVSAHAGQCLPYGNQGTTLTGRVSIETFFGPPNYGESPETDAKERQAILRLEKPICTMASKDEQAESNQMKVTLVPMGGFSLQPFAGKQVTVNGALFHAVTGHHNTPVLISINQPPEVRK